MATKRRRKHDRPDDHDTGEFYAKRRRWPFWWAGIIGLMLVLVWTAPTIVAKTSLKDGILSAALADFEGSVTVGSASAGWFSVVSARDVAAFDSDGQPLATVASLRTGETLLAMLSNMQGPKSFRVENPHVHLAIDQQGSNWETALAAWLRDDSGQQSSDLQIEIIGGAVSMTDEVSRRKFEIANLDASVSVPSQPNKPLSAKFVAQVASPAQSPAKIAGDLIWKSGPTEGGGQLDLRSQAFPLEVITPVLRRYLADADLRGLATCDAVLRWRNDGSEIRLDVKQLDAADLAVRVPAWFGDDTLHTNQWTSRGQFNWAGGQWHFTNVLLDSNFLRLQADGIADASVLALDQPWPRTIAALQRQPLRLSAEIDAPGLAKSLPNTLRLRPTTQIESGKITANLQTTTGQNPSFVANVVTADLAASEDGRRFTWQQPLVLRANFRQTSDGPVVENLTCESEFLNLAAKGTITSGSASVRGDLDRMAAEIGRFVDLGDWKMAGKLDGNFSWTSDPQQQLVGDGQFVLRDFELSGDRPWREQQLNLEASVKAAVADNAISRLDSAQLNLVSNNDKLEVKLMQAVDRPGAKSTWPLRIVGQGDLATWLPRLRPFFDVGQLEAAGKLHLETTAAVTMQNLQTRPLKLELTNVKMQAPGFDVDEPLVRVESAAFWDYASHAVVAEDTTLVSSTASFRADQLTVRFPKGQPALAGVLSYRTDLERLFNTLAGRRRQRATRFTGGVTGVVQASHVNNVTDVKWTADVANFAMHSRPQKSAAPVVAAVSQSDAWRTIWQETGVKLTGESQYDAAADSLSIKQFTAAAVDYQVAGNGRMDKLFGERHVDLRGQATYDLAGLSKKLRPLIGPNVHLTGKDQGTFELKGPLLTAKTADAASAPPPLVPNSLTGKARLGWHSADLYGLPIGAGELDLQLAESIVKMKPQSIAVSGGKLHLSPTIDCRSPYPLLNLPPGALVENIALTPQLCQTWLMYVAPLLAKATRAEGRFSVALEEAIVPIFDPYRSTVRGQLEVQQGQVGPGPLAQQILVAAGQIKALAGQQSTPSTTWLVIPPQKMAVDARDGRVHHRGFTMQAQDVQIVTRGSVGFDQSLAIAADVPIRDQWVANKPLLAAMRGTSLTLPVGGSLNKPQIDTRALADVNKRLLRDAAGRALENEINRGLQQLFGPRP